MVVCLRVVSCADSTRMYTPIQTDTDIDTETDGGGRYLLSRVRRYCGADPKEVPPSLSQMNDSRTYVYPRRRICSKPPSVATHTRTQRPKDTSPIRNKTPILRRERERKKERERERDLSLFPIEVRIVSCRTVPPFFFFEREVDMIGHDTYTETTCTVFPICVRISSYPSIQRWTDTRVQ